MNSLHIATLAQQSPERRKAQLRELITESLNTPREVWRTRLDADIRDFESRHGMASDVMLAKLNAGTIKETRDICSWLMVLKEREELGSAP